MTPNISDKLTYVAVGTKTELAAPGHSIGGNTINCNDLSAWATPGAKSAVYFGIDIVDASGKRINGTYTEWKGILSGGAIGSMQLITGNDQNYPAGATTRVFMLLTAAWANSLIDGLTNQHNKDGSHKAITTDTLTASGAVATGALTVTGNASISGNVTAANGSFSGLLTAGSSTTASGATITPAANANTYTVTALAVNATIAVPAGTPVEGQALTLRIRDNGVPRTLTWNATYRAINVTLPTTTVANKLMYINMKYNSVDSKWDVLAVGKEA